MRASEKPEFTRELDQQWRDEVKTRTDASLSADGKKFVQPLFSDEDALVQCRRQVYENLGKGRDGDLEIATAIALKTLSSLKAIRTDDLRLAEAESDELYIILRKATQAIVDTLSIDPMDGIDLSELNLD